MNIELYYRNDLTISFKQVSNFGDKLRLLKNVTMFRCYTHITLPVFNTEEEMMFFILDHIYADDQIIDDDWPCEGLTLCR